MPFPFVLGTTSHLAFQANFTSSTHPSLPSATTTHRNMVRSVLKMHKRLSAVDQASNLGTIVNVLQDYLKYLLSIDAALSGKSVAGEDVDVTLQKEVEVEWRPTLAGSLMPVPGREPERVKGRGLDYEIFFVHQTCAVVQNQLARQALLGLYAPILPSAEQRVSLVQSATKYLRSAYSIHKHLTTQAHSVESSSVSFPPQAVDINVSVQTALLRLTHAEVNLLCVMKDDPWPAVLLQSRNKDDKEWMIKAPDIPKTRAQVLTRLCIGAAEHAAAASATLKAEAGTASATSSKRVSKDLIEYVDDLRATARARACRFQALDHDQTGQTGMALAWLHAAMNELGLDLFASSDSFSPSQGRSHILSSSTATTPRDGKREGSSTFSKLKTQWTTRREDKKISRGSSTWGADGGKIEESRIVQYLERKYSRVNDTINVQLVPEWRPLLSKLPTGMNIPMGGSSGTSSNHGSGSDSWNPPLLSEDELLAMRAPPDRDDEGPNFGDDDDEDDDEENEMHGNNDHAGNLSNDMNRLNLNNNSGNNTNLGSTAAGGGGPGPGPGSGSVSGGAGPGAFPGTQHEYSSHAQSSYTGTVSGSGTGTVSGSDPTTSSSSTYY